MPTRFPNGITTAVPTAPLGDFLLPDFTALHTFFDDFNTYDAAEWTVTEVGAATQALVDAENGALLITNAAADNDSSFQQLVGESFSFSPNKKLWFDCKLQVNDC